MADQGAVLVFLAMVILVQFSKGDAHQMLALLAFYFVLSRRLLPLTSQIAFIAGEMESAWESVRVVDTELCECSRYRASESPALLPSTGYAVEFSRVSFSYRKDKSILTDVDFRLREGEIVILQGASGIGKSSLLNLIAGLTQPQSGEIRCDRAEVCYVPQEVPLLDGSIRSNLLFGLAGVSDDKLMDALAIARLDQFIAAQPSGLATSVGDNVLCFPVGNASGLDWRVHWYGAATHFFLTRPRLRSTKTASVKSSKRSAPPARPSCS